MSLPRILEKFSQNYDLAQKMWFKKAFVIIDPTQLLNDSLNAILFFTGFAHERSGRNPRFSLYHRVAIKKALKNRSFDDVLLNNSYFPSDVWKEFKGMAEKPNERITKGVVKNILEKMMIKKEPNIVSIVSKQPVIDSYLWLKGIRGIGPKIASLFLRDVESLIRPWKNIPQQNLYCLQPIDRWVRFWSKECWPNQTWPKEYQVESWAKKVVNLCTQNNINPQKFNNGAWFVGSHFDDLCCYFNVPEFDRINLPNCVVKYFKANKVFPAIKNFVIQFEYQNIFPI